MKAENSVKELETNKHTEQQGLVTAFINQSHVNRRKPAILLDYYCRQNKVMKEGLDSTQVEKAELHPTLSQAGKRNTQSTHAYVKEVKKLPVETMM